MHAAGVHCALYDSSREALAMLAKTRRPALPDPAMHCILCVGRRSSIEEFFVHNHRPQADRDNNNRSTTTRCYGGTLSPTWWVHDHVPQTTFYDPR